LCCVRGDGWEVTEPGGGQQAKPAESSQHDERQVKIVECRLADGRRRVEINHEDTKLLRARTIEKSECRYQRSERQEANRQERQACKDILFPDLLCALVVNSHVGPRVPLPS